MNISIIIPVINEHEFVGPAIERAWGAGAAEVIVVDGGSTDETLEIAQAMNCKLIHSEPGRAVQQNAGAEIAIGDVLLFLHVDTWLATGACSQIREQLSNAAIIAGVFEQKIENPKWIYRWIEWGNAFRVRWQNLAYGDQGIFIRKQSFVELGQFPEQPLMEDYMFSQRFRRKYKFVICKGPLHVAARRWERFGPIRQTIRNWSIATRFRFGVSPEKLAASYRRHDRD